MEDYETAWESQIAVRYFPSFLTKEARDWFVAMIQPRVNEGSECYGLRSWFMRFYLGPEEAEAVKDELRAAVQRPGEPATKFIPRIMRLMELAGFRRSEAEKVREVKVKLRNIYRDRMAKAQDLRRTQRPLP